MNLWPHFIIFRMAIFKIKSKRGISYFKALYFGENDGISYFKELYFGKNEQHGPRGHIDNLSAARDWSKLLDIVVRTLREPGTHSQQAVGQKTLSSHLPYFLDYKSHLCIVTILSKRQFIRKKRI